MVRERVGDWRLAWRFALAGVVAGLLVITLAQTGVTAGTFDAGQEVMLFDVDLDHLTGNNIEPPVEETDITLTRAIQAATSACTAKKQLYTTQSVFA